MPDESYYIRVDGEPACCSEYTLRPIKERFIVCQYSYLADAINAAADLKEAFPTLEIEVINGHCPRPNSKIDLD